MDLIAPRVRSLELPMLAYVASEEPEARRGDAVGAAGGPEGGVAENVASVPAAQAERGRARTVSRGG